MVMLVCECVFSANAIRYVDILFRPNGDVTDLSSHMVAVLNYKFLVCAYIAHSSSVQHIHKRKDFVRMGKRIL